MAVVPSVQRAAGYLHLAWRASSPGIVSPWTAPLLTAWHKTFVWAKPTHTGDYTWIHCSKQMEQRFSAPSDALYQRSWARPRQCLVYGQWLTEVAPNTHAAPSGKFAGQLRAHYCHYFTPHWSTFPNSHAESLTAFAARLCHAILRVTQLVGHNSSGTTKANWPATATETDATLA